MRTNTALKTPVAQAPVIEAGPSLYTLEVSLVSGPMTEAFAEENPDVTRTIQIRGNQTLEDLHDAIFTAFDREDDNMYEFRLGSVEHDADSRYYVLPSELNRTLGKRKVIAGDVTKSRIDSLNLKPGETFTYWFDFSDDWMHRITVSGVDETFKPGKYPRTIARVGESPAQYPDIEDEDAEEEELLEEEWSTMY
jgi:hypothetical protein